MVPVLFLHLPCPSGQPSNRAAIGRPAVNTARRAPACCERRRREHPRPDGSSFAGGAHRPLSPLLGTLYHAIRRIPLANAEVANARMARESHGVDALQKLVSETILAMQSAV